MKGLMNPFIISGYEGAEYFCDRVAKTNQLASEIANGNNVALIATRRMDKSGLVLPRISPPRRSCKPMRCLLPARYNPQFGACWRKNTSPCFMVFIRCTICSSHIGYVRNNELFHRGYNLMNCTRFIRIKPAFVHVLG